MNALAERYKSDGIWTGASSRTSCVVPEIPLLISTDEEYAYNKLALAVWNALENVIANGIDSIANGARPFPDGSTMPPAVRIDTVRTVDGPKIVEIDPVSAISIGETSSLIRIWQEQGYQVPTGLSQVIVSDILKSGRGFAIDLPRGKEDYNAELEYLRKLMLESGVEQREGLDAIQLSAFNEVPARRKTINRDGWLGRVNPLWGSLIGIADKSNLRLLVSGDKTNLPIFLPKSYEKKDLDDLDPDTQLIAKPLMGTGSSGVRQVTAKAGLSLSGGYIYQDMLTPATDFFGECVEISGASTENTEWVSRVSVYAGRYGLLGAEVTARPRNPSGFTNAHGQQDAVQTTIAVKNMESKDV